MMITPLSLLSCVSKNNKGCYAVISRKKMHALSQEMRERKFCCVMAYYGSGLYPLPKIAKVECCEQGDSFNRASTPFATPLHI